MICGVLAPVSCPVLGVPEPIAMAIMGHKTHAMHDRYKIVDEDDIRSALTQAEQQRTRRGYNLATSPPQQAEQEGSTKI